MVSSAAHNGVQGSEREIRELRVKRASLQSMADKRTKVVLYGLRPKGTVQTCPNRQDRQHRENEGVNPPGRKTAEKGKKPTILYL